MKVLYNILYAKQAAQTCLQQLLTQKPLPLLHPLRLLHLEQAAVRLQVHN
jgi:hypothetical protein